MLLFTHAKKPYLDILYYIRSIQGVHSPLKASKVQGIITVHIDAMCRVRVKCHANHSKLLSTVVLSGDI